MPSAKLGPYTVNFQSSEEYHHLKQEIFTQDTYYFETENPQPMIIDAGAHIGLSTLYFKKLYPGARVIAIEPLPQNFELLQQNVWENNLSNVETHQVALAARGEKADFYFDASSDHWFSTAGFTEGAWTKTQQSQMVTVPVRRLSEFLQPPIDLLKLDIEGAEEEVLYEAREQLTHVKQMWIEFHPLPHQSLSHLTKLLTDHGFAFQLWQKGKEVIKPKSGLVLIEAVAQK